MPVSEISNIPPILSEVVRLQPKTILDLGIGGGKFGTLCREVLDWVHGRVKPRTWKTQIFGVEGFEDYRNPAWGVYDDVWIEDFSKKAEYYRDIDCVLILDSLEHLEKAEAEVFLHQIVSQNKRVIVSVPLGHCPQGEVFNNTYEKHRSTWYGEQDFSQYNYRVLHRGVCLVLSIQGGK